MKKIVIETDQAPAATGPYTQALAAGPFVFISGQIPLDAKGRLVEGDIVVQTVQVMANLKAILGAVGLTLKDVVKTTVYLAGPGRFPGDEPGLRRVLPPTPAGPHHYPGGGPAPESVRGDRRHRGEKGVALVRVFEGGPGDFLIPSCVQKGTKNVGAHLCVRPLRGDGQVPPTRIVL